MSKLKSAQTAVLGEGEPGLPLPGRLLEGSPEFRSWPLIEGRIGAGVWLATPGHHRVIREDDLIESFYIVEGAIDLYEDGSDAPQRFGPGDLVVMEPGFSGSWKTISTVKKIYFTAR